MGLGVRLTFFPSDEICNVVAEINGRAYNSFIKILRRVHIGKLQNTHNSSIFRYNTATITGNNTVINTFILLGNDINVKFGDVIFKKLCEKDLSNYH